jgi:hypothetical protein
LGYELELNDEQTEALVQGLCKLIDGDRYPLNPRIRVMRNILDPGLKIKPCQK